MSWAKVDDSFYDHPKVLDVDLAALGLWVKALSYCGRHLTDGRVSRGAVIALAGERGTELAKMLIVAGLWEAAKGGYEIHDYLAHNPSKAEVMARRADDRERQRLSRQRSGRDDTGRFSPLSQRDTDRSHSVGHTVPDPTRPVPRGTRGSYYRWRRSHPKPGDRSRSSSRERAEQRRRTPRHPHLRGTVREGLHPRAGRTGHAAPSAYRPAPGGQEARLISWWPPSRTLDDVPRRVSFAGGGR